MEVIKYRKNDKLTYKPGNAVVTVIHNTLKPGGGNAEDATIWIETKAGTPISIPVAEQDRYLTTDPPKKGFLAKWPLPKQ